MNKKIILASTSKIRQIMLEEYGIIFETASPDCDEEFLKDDLQSWQKKDIALALARAKAVSVADEEPDSYVIGSDQICEFNNEIIDKSKNRDEAFTTLKKLQGQTHIQNNATVIYHQGKEVFKNVEQVKLRMKKLTDQQINEYIDKDNPIGCAGSYKFEQNGFSLFAEIHGSTDGIKGFAAEKLAQFFSNKI
jgi:MAF protein